MKYEDACYIAASAKHINKTNSVVLPFSSKICLTFYNELYLYTQGSFPYSMSFKKALISCLMSNSDIHGIEWAYYQVTKNKIEMMNEDFSNLPHPLPPFPPTPPTPPPPAQKHKTTFKNAANAKATSFNCAPDTKKRAQEVEKAYINCKDKFIPVKKTEIKNDYNNSFSFRSLKKIPEEMQEPII